MSLELPRALGPFLLLRHLASGGMGDVYLAHQKLGLVERLCVVKTVRPEAARDESMMTRFMDEARTAAFLSHKNVAAVLDVGEADGTAYLAVDYVAGRDLQSVIRTAKKNGVVIEEDVALYIIGELLEGLAYVHGATHPRTLEPLAIVHRDISPHNVMVSFTGEVKIIDFGIARSSVKREVTQAGQAIGKVRYMAPEQARAETVDAAADIWAASIVATEVLTRKRFWGDAPLESILLRVATGTAPRTDALNALPEGLRRAIKAGLNTDRHKRPTAAELKAMILAQSNARPSSEKTKALLEVLFQGEESDERKAHALLLQEPTKVHADKLFSRTMHEETPTSGLGVDREAPTASRIAAPGMMMGGDLPIVDGEAPTAPPPKSFADEGTLAAPLVAVTDDAIVDVQRSNPRLKQRAPRVREISTTTRSNVSVARPRRSQMFPLGVVAGIVLAVCGAIAVGILAFHPDPTPEEAPPPPSQPKTHADFDPPIEDRAPIALPPVPPVVVDAGVVVVDVPPVPKTDAPKVAVKSHPNKHVDREAHEPASSAPKPTGIFGDDVKSLNRCAPRPICAASVLRRANDVSAVKSLSPTDLAGLRDDVEWCLKQCK